VKTYHIRSRSGSEDDEGRSASASTQASRVFRQSLVKFQSVVVQNFIRYFRLVGLHDVW
jgi:hypothetical protein